MLFGHLPGPVAKDWDHNSGIPSRMSNHLLLTESHLRYSVHTVKNWVQIISSSMNWTVFSLPACSKMDVIRYRYRFYTRKPRHVPINWIP